MSTAVVKALVDESELPDPLPELVRDVVRGTRLFRQEKVTVAEELIGHFRDGLEAGRSADELVADFGDAEQAARLIGRAKRRNRPLAYRASVRSVQATGALIGLLLLLYGFTALRFFWGKPNPTVDFLSQINAAALAAPPEDRAWPEYRAAILALGPSPKLGYGRTPRPGEPDWDVVDAYLQDNRAALQRIWAGGARPVLGYEIGFGIADEDRELWPDLAAAVVPTSEDSLFSVLLPYLADLRTLSRLVVDDARWAAAHGDSETALADFQALLSMVRQVRGSGFVINDLSGLAMFAMGLNGIGQVLHDYPDLFSDGQLTDLAHRLGAFGGGGPIRISLDGERIGFSDLLQHAYTDDGQGDGRLTWDGLKLMNMMGTGIPEPPGPVMVTAGPAVGAFGASRAELMKKYDVLLAMVEAEASRPMWERGRSPVDEEVDRIKSSLTESFKFLPIALLMPALGNVSINAEMSTLRRDAMLVVFALELYRRRHGAWPSELEALVPRLLPEVPPDRFDGQPIRYILRAGEPVLYSVGTDRDDDGGRPPAPYADWARVWISPEDLEEAAAGGTRRRPIPDGDWVLWPPGPVDPLGTPDPEQAWPIYRFDRYAR